MSIKAYQSETGEYIEVDGVGKLKYIGESFGVDSLTNGRTYDVLEILEDDLVRVVDDSDEDYLYSASNPAPLDGSSEGGKWEIIEDENGILAEVIK